MTGRHAKSAAGELADIEADADAAAPEPEPKARIVEPVQPERYTFSLERYWARRRRGVTGHFCRITKSMVSGGWRECACKGETND